MNLSSPIESLVPGLRGKVLTALVRSPRPLSGREIARRAGSSSPGSVKLAIEALEAEGIVTLALASTSGQFYVLNHDHVFASHLLAIDHAKDAMMDAIRDCVDQWPVAPRGVVLFGSVARHEDRADSDVDLLIVWRGVSAPAGEWTARKAELIEAIQMLTGNVVNIVDMPEPEWESAVAAGEPLVREIARDGVTVLGASVHDLTRDSLGAES